jgi:hypothetical protein
VTEPADREWERILAHVDLDVADEDLAAAEQRLRDLPEADVTPMRSDWIEATVQTAVEAAAPVVPVQRTWWRRLQGVAAAAAALIGFQSIAAASFTVGAVVVTGVVVVSSLWPEEVNSDQTLSFGRAIAVLRTNAETGQLSAAIQVRWRLEVCVDLVQQAASSSDSSEALLGMSLLNQLRSELSSTSANPPVSPLIDDFDARVNSIRSGVWGDLTPLVSQSIHGIRALRAVVDPAVSINAQAFLVSLRAKAEA